MNNDNEIDYFLIEVETIKQYLSMVGISTDQSIVVCSHIPNTQQWLNTTDEKCFHVVLQYVIDELSSKGQNCKIVFALQSEGFMIYNILFYDRIARYVMTTYNFPKSNLFYLTGTARTKRNLMLYHKYSEQCNFVPLTLIHTSVFENNGVTWHREIKKELPIEKKFVCFNRGPRLHRQVIVSEIINRNLIKDCFLSYGLAGPNSPLDRKDPHALIVNPTMLTTMFSKKIAEDVEKSINTVLHMLPLNVTLLRDDSNQHSPTDADIRVHNTSLFSLVTETIFFNNSKFYLDQKCYNETMCYPASFFTEKTWRCVRLKHPFILVTTPHVLADLRELGYKTFHPYINEEYDSIEDEYSRITAIMNEVERLCGMTDQETTEWLANVSSICEYNYKLLKSRKYPIVYQVC
jgi:hypothetical protein